MAWAQPAAAAPLRHRGVTLNLLPDFLEQPTLIYVTAAERD